MNRKYDQHTMQLMSMFEQMTGSKLRDCFTVDDLQVFVVEKGQIGRAVGRAGANVKKLAAALKSKIKIIEHSSDLAEFVSNTIHPIKPARVEVDDENKIATITPPDLLSRGLLIGRQAIKLRETEKIVQRFFDLTELKVGRPEEGPQSVEEVRSQDEDRETIGGTGSDAPAEPMTLGDAAGASLASSTATEEGDTAAEPAEPEAPVKTDNDPVEKSPKGETPRNVSAEDAPEDTVVDETPAADVDTVSDGAMSTDDTTRLDENVEDVAPGAEVEGANAEFEGDFPEVEGEEPEARDEDTEEASEDEEPQASKKESKTE